eukprot:1805429-Pleurochrysis_carterae.AAC.2
MTKSYRSMVPNSSSSFSYPNRLRYLTLTTARWSVLEDAVQELVASPDRPSLRHHALTPASYTREA